MPKLNAPMSTQLTSAWRQTRIFSRNFTDAWYLDLLTSVVIPFHHRFPEAPFFVTRYRSVRNAADEDKADTEIQNLPGAFLNPADNEHRSLRLRYAATGEEDSFLDHQIDRNRFWISDIRGFDVVDGLGNPRFSTSTDLGRRRMRAEIFAQILWHHSRLVLDTVVNPGGAAEFEENIDRNNTDQRTVFATELHLLKNSMATKYLPRLELALQSRLNPAGPWIVL